MSNPYSIAQQAMAQLKSAVYQVLESGPESGLTNAATGRALGVYAGHVGHEGHISRTLLALMQSEGVAQQNDKTLHWTLRLHGSSAEDDTSGG